MDDQSGFLAMKALLEEKNDAIDSPKAADDDENDPKNASSHESSSEVSNLEKSYIFLKEKLFSCLLMKNSPIMKLNLRLLDLEKTLLTLLRPLKLLKLLWTQD